MQRLYCYVDETGQDTKGQFFLVSVVITGRERDELKIKLEKIERETKKGPLKWHKSSFERKLDYIRAIISSSLFKGKIFFSQYLQTKAYVELTVHTTAKAILRRSKGDYKVTVFVDGLSKSEIGQFVKGLRRLSIKVRKVRGLREEGDPLIRLADAMAGFIRDFIEGRAYAQEIFQKAIEKEVIREI